MIQNEQNPFDQAFQQDPTGVSDGEPQDEDLDSPWDISGSEDEGNILYVQDKFPQAPVGVARRLGKMISRRQQLLRYRETHSTELQIGRIEPPTAALELPREEEPKIGRNDTKAHIPQSTNIRESAESQAPSGRDTLHTKATTLRVENDPAYAPSIAESNTSLASTSTGKLTVQIPPRPLGEDGKELEEFECPRCFILQRARTPHQWK